MEKKKVVNTPAKWWPRIISGAIILVVLVSFFLLRELSEYVFDLLIGAVMIMCAYEVENLMHKMDRPTWSVSVGIFPVLSFIMMVIVTNCSLNFYHFILLNFGILLAMFLVLFALPLLAQKWGKKCKLKDEFTCSLVYYSFQKAINSIFVCLWPAFFLSFIFILNHFNFLTMSGLAYEFAHLNPGVDFGLLALVLLFVSTIFADTFAMLTGRLLKGPKISIEKLGPGKSWSGFAGGIVGALIGTLIVYGIFNCFEVYNLLFMNVGIGAFVLGGLFSGLFCMCGDMFSSLFKRRAVVKDFSNIIPGHGGIMDRCNGLLFNAVFVFVLFIILFV